MSLFSRIFGEPEIRSLNAKTKAEVNQMIDELVKIGRMDDFISLTPWWTFRLPMPPPGSQRNRQKVKCYWRNPADDGCASDHKTQAQGRPGGAS